MLSFWTSLNPLPGDKILDWSKLKQFADDNCKKYSKLVEDIVGKGEIACYEQFFLFPQCFQKAYLPGASKGVIVWEWVKLIEFNQIQWIPINRNPDNGDFGYLQHFV